MQGCKDIQKKIADFNNGRLSLKDEESFVRHLEQCADCQEELEIYYIVSYGLSEDEALVMPPKYQKLLDSFDFKGLVDLRLKDCMGRIEKIRVLERASMLCLAFADICMALVCIILLILRYC